MSKVLQEEGIHACFLVFLVLEHEARPESLRRMRLRICQTDERGPLKKNNEQSNSNAIVLDTRFGSCLLCKAHKCMTIYSDKTFCSAHPVYCKVMPRGIAA